MDFPLSRQMPDKLNAVLDSCPHRNDNTRTHPFTIEQPSAPMNATVTASPTSNIATTLRWTRRVFQQATLKRGIKFFVRALLWSRVTTPWLAFIESDPKLADYASRKIRFVEKIYRPYLSTRFSMAERLTIIQSHYRFVEASPCRERLWLALDNKLPDITCGKDNELILQLQSSSFEKEGELALRLVNASGISLSILTFTIALEKGVPTLYACGLQGAKPGNQENIKIATASLGRTPLKLFMGRALLVLAEILDIQRVLGVDDSVHPYHDDRYKSRRRRVKAHYTETWTALGGQQTEDGFWLLPTSEETAPAAKQNAASQRKAEVINNLRPRMRELLLQD